jgi:hypothetical protein
MPAEGFAWIAKNPAAFAAWLGVVEGESSGGVSHQLLALSEKELYVLAQQEELLEQLFRAHSLEELLRLTGLTEQELLKLLPTLHGTENESSELAVEFFEWLERQNQEGLLHLISERQYLLSPVSLAFLMHEAPGRFGNWFNFYKKSLTLGFTVLTPSDKALQTFLVQSTPVQAHTPAHAEIKTTTDLFHQTLHDKNEPTPQPTNTTQDALIHQQHLEQTVQALNNRGLMVTGTLFGAAHHVSTERNMTQTQQQQSQLTHSAEVRDQSAQLNDTLDQLFRQRTQQLATRQQQLRRMVETQYPQAENKARSSFSYSKKI